MKIAILGPVITDQYFGGVATFDEALAKAFQKIGHDVSILTSQKGSITNKKIKIKQIKKSEISNIVNENNTDLTIASLQYGTSLKSIQTGKKVYFLHGFFNVQSYGIAKTLAATALTQKMTSYADCVIANSSFTAAINQRIWNIHVDGVAHLAVDEQKRVLFVGRLAVSKHVERIIQAVSLMSKNSYELIIAGDGPEKQNLLHKAKELNVNAKFIDRVEHDQISTIYRRCGVFVSLSESEPYGLTYAEALLSGCQIVCPSTGGQVEYLMKYSDRTHFIDVLDPESIARGITDGLKAKEAAVDNNMISKFSYSETANRILTLVSKKY
jgi:glycosyltransferase involved in cell wall biosynthesis